MCTYLMKKIVPKKQSVGKSHSSVPKFVHPAEDELDTAVLQGIILTTMPV